MIGKRLGGYRIEGAIGKGGMGEVYVARQVDLDRRVALKLLPPQLTVDKAFVQRFRREARAVAQLNHPNIVQVFDIGEEDGVHYFTMELVEGETLDDRVFRKRHLDVSDAVRTVVQICRGLHAAHDAGIIHRDIKPANILFDHRGRVKLTDFGIALQGSGDRLTTLGTIVGTPEYMSPEQAGGKTVTPESDIYSLGTVFYEMLTGCVPFDNRDALTTLQQHQFDEPRRPSEINPDVPADVERVVLKMLAKEPEARYRHCADVVTDLRAIAKGDGASSSASGVDSTGAPQRAAPGPLGARWPLLLGGGALAIGGAVLGAFLVGRDAPPPPPAAITAPPPARRVPDAEVRVGLLSLYEARTEQVAERVRVHVRLRDGGVVAAVEAELTDDGAIITVADVGVVCLPAAALAPDAPIESAPASGGDAADPRAARMWARDVFDTWKLDHQVDTVQVGQMPTLLEEAAALLPPLPPPLHHTALRVVADGCDHLVAARAGLAASETALAQARAESPDAQLRFGDRVVLRSGRELRCRILDRESDLETMRVQLSAGGRMRIAFADVRHFERAYGQAATVAERARTAVASHRERVTAAKAQVETHRAQLATIKAQYDVAVARLLASAAPLAPDSESEPAPSAAAPESPPQPR